MSSGNTVFQKLEVSILFSLAFYELDAELKITLLLTRIEKLNRFKNND